MEIRINIQFKNIKKWGDSEKRVDHIFDRMQLRGIGNDQIREAIQKGARTIRNDGSIIAVYKWFKVVYREFRMDDIRKIYPITVMEV